MKRLVLTALLLCPLPAAAQTPYKCGMAVLHDVEAVVETFAVPTTTHVKTKRGKHGREEAVVVTSTGERQEKNYLMTIELEDIRYTVQSSGNFWNFDPTRLVINDPIGVCVDGNRVVVKRPDGKDFKAKIVRAARTETRH